MMDDSENPWVTTGSTRVEKPLTVDSQGNPYATYHRWVGATHIPKASIVEEDVERIAEMVVLKLIAAGAIHGKVQGK